MKRFSFKILHEEKKTKARVGEITTPHGKILTPAFVPVGTQASIKSLSPEEITKTGTQIFFVNTYHMMLRPGADLIEKMGGLHKFANWNGPLITDSGGFQVFSLGFGIEHGVGKIANIFPDEADRNRVLCSPTGNLDASSDSLAMKRFASKEKSSALANEAALNLVGSQHALFKSNLVKISDGGVVFRSHLDGKKIFLTPEKSIEIQKKLGADIILAFDECTSPLSDYNYTKKAMERTHRWALRSLKTAQCKPSRNQALYGIVQGGEYQDLREESARFINNLNFSGIAIGGSLGKSKSDMENIIDWVIPLLNKEKPRHLLGIGEIEDIFNIIEKGIDTFDCVGPTRLARSGTVYCSSPDGYRGENFSLRSKNNYTMDITKSAYSADKNTIDKTCSCYSCQNFSRAYINHLFKARELLGYRLATIHNLFFINSLVSEIRGAILKNKFLDLKRKWMIQ